MELYFRWSGDGWIYFAMPRCNLCNFLICTHKKRGQKKFSMLSHDNLSWQCAFSCFLRICSWLNSPSVVNISVTQMVEKVRVELSVCSQVNSKTCLTSQYTRDIIKRSWIIHDNSLSCSGTIQFHITYKMYGMINSIHVSWYFYDRFYILSSTCDFAGGLAR